MTTSSLEFSRQRLVVFSVLICALIILFLIAMPGDFKNLSSDKDAPDSRLRGSNLPAYSFWNVQKFNSESVHCYNQKNEPVTIDLTVEDKLNNILGQESATLSGYGSFIFDITKYWWVTIISDAAICHPGASI